MRSRSGSLAAARNTCAFGHVDLPWTEYLDLETQRRALHRWPIAQRSSRSGCCAARKPKSIAGSAVCSNAEIRKMFHFSATHAIMPMTEPYPMKEVNQVRNRLRQNLVRYRAVLVNES